MCEYCEKKKGFFNKYKTIHSCNYCGQGKARIVGDTLCILEKENERRFKINYCPMCGMNLKNGTDIVVGRKEKQ